MNFDEESRSPRDAGAPGGDAGATVSGGEGDAAGRDPVAAAPSAMEEGGGVEGSPAPRPGGRSTSEGDRDDGDKVREVGSTFRV